MCCAPKKKGSALSMNDALDAIRALAVGFATTFKHLFRKPITEEYPEYKRPLPDRSRARIILSMQSAEREDGRRYAEWFRINFARCIYCGLCEEACPTSAIQLTPEFENCQRDILTLVYEKKDLLADHQGKDKEYNFYKYAGVVTGVGKKGEHIKEDQPVNIKSNLP
jgi:NADH-quinone oxidoreductase subunit I